MLTGGGRLLTDAEAQAVADAIGCLLERPSEYVGGQTDDSDGTYKDAATLVFTPRCTGTNDWAIRFDCLVRNAAGFGVWSRLLIDGAPYAEGFNEDGGDWLHESGATRIPLNQTSHTIKLQVKSSTPAQTASAKEVFVVAKRVAV
jgi:hypothetical protein